MRNTLPKRLQALLLALCLLLTLLPTASAREAGSAEIRGDEQNPFTDVKPGKYYYDAVLWAYYHDPQIASGATPDTFGVKNPCTREQIVTFLWNAFGAPEPETEENPFTDVKPGKYYYKAVLWAVENGITTGATPTTFGVKKTCNRGDVMTFLWNAAGAPEPETTENPFTDVKPSKYYYKPVLWAVENGITTGATPTTFGPKNTCTRAQIVSFLYTAFGGEYEGYISELDGEGHYVRANDDERYEDVFGDYLEGMEAARGAAASDERWVLEAQAEAALLDTAAVMPMTTQGGAFAMSRVAPHTTPHVMWGNDAQRLSGLVISDEFISRTEREELEAQWKAAAAGNGTYDPAAYLAGKGHTLLTAYNNTFSSSLTTLDWMASGYNRDMDILANCTEGLVQFDNLGDLQPALAESWEVSADGLTYTFHIRQGVKWCAWDGSVYAELTANDFVAGLRHMLDCQAGLESLAGWYGADIVGVEAYLYEDAPFDSVGCKAADDHTLVFTLNRPSTCFLSLLTYNIFLPICDSFYRSRGGVYGLEAYAEARENGSISYGRVTDLSSQVYCGPYVLWEAEDSEILCVKSGEYYRADQVNVTSLHWVYDAGYDPNACYDSTLAGDYVGVTLAAYGGLLDRAKADGNFDRYAYVTDNGATTYFAGLNLNRGTFALENGACASPKSEQEKADTVTALNNKNLRKALQHAFDKKTWNADSRGEEMAETNLRNMLTPPDFVKLQSAVTDAQGHTFPAGTFYGEIVQYYCDQIGCKIDCADGVDGWYKPSEAQAYLQKAKQELGGCVTWPIQIDLVYYTVSDSQYWQANAYKTSIETVLGAENVVVNLIAADNAQDYYACGYRAYSGEEGNFDIFWGTGWNGEYGDPGAYLDTFDYSVNGYMLRIVGLY